MKTQNVGCKSKLMAGAMAGVMTFGATGGFGFVATASAQDKKPAAATPAPKKAAPPGKRPAKETEKDPELQRARVAYASGETKFKAGDYAGALTDFQTADGIKSSPQAARYIGQCQDNLGKFPEAVAAYERFLANVPPKLQKEGEEITKRVEQIKAMPGVVHVVTAPAGASISVDGKPPVVVSPTDVELAPGKHTLHFTADGRVPQDKEVDAKFAERQELTVELEVKAEPPPPAPVAAAPAPEPPPPPKPAVVETRSMVPAYITGGLAVAAAGVGTAFGVMALGARSDFDKNPTTSTADDGENQALIADMAFGVAITLGVTSLVLFLSGDEASPTKAQLPRTGVRSVAATKPPVTFSAAPIVTSSGGGASAVLHF